MTSNRRQQMRKFSFLIIIAIVGLVISSCGTTNNQNADDNQGADFSNTDNGVENNEQLIKDSPNNTENITSENNLSSDDMLTKMEQLDYVDFELAVEYDEDQEFEVSLELDDHGEVEADIEDDLNGVNLYGQEAFATIYPLVEQLTITQDTAKDEAIKQVLAVFGLEENYREFELEITFNDGTKVEFEDR